MASRPWIITSDLRAVGAGTCFYLINAIEKCGSDFIRIRKALQEHPKIDFEIKEFAGGVMATFSQREEVSGGVSGVLRFLTVLARYNSSISIPAHRGVAIHKEPSLRGSAGYMAIPVFSLEPCILNIDPLGSNFGSGRDGCNQPPKISKA